ncbi:co-regulatory protein PtrA N-terminal domain-containing protein [Pseudomonas sp. NPDC089569]|uniref:co-regulatory protein PtrA N-terminal domain-containing protein n=1 Tax=Pseudomonas sp. NPDC089569 TaxID=3390722 RepID=UPI003CFEAE5B
MKKTIEGMILASLLVSSLAAFADSGGDIVAARADEATQKTMEHYRQEIKERAAMAASSHKAEQPGADQDQGHS